jgi:hypothetical protein
VSSSLCVCFVYASVLTRFFRTHLTSTVATAMWNTGLHGCIPHCEERLSRSLFSPLVSQVEVGGYFVAAVVYSFVFSLFQVMTNCFIFVVPSFNGAYYYHHRRHPHIPRSCLHVILQLLLCIPFKQFTRPRNNLSAASPSLSGETASVFTLTSWSMITTITNNNMYHDNFNDTVTTLLCSNQPPALPPSVFRSAPTPAHAISYIASSARTWSLDQCNAATVISVIWRSPSHLTLTLPSSRVFLHHVHLVMPQKFHVLLFSDGFPQLCYAGPQTLSVGSFSSSSFPCAHN